VKSALMKLTVWSKTSVSRSNGPSISFGQRPGARAQSTPRPLLLLVTRRPDVEEMTSKN
jgi:hypothetical protein